jgi:hypothetical protein
MPTRATLIRRLFIPNLTLSPTYSRLLVFALSSHLKIVCRIYDTTAPTKEGLLEDDKIVSNLPEQIRGTGYRNQHSPPVWCAAFQRQPIMLIAFALFATQGEYDG